MASRRSKGPAAPWSARCLLPSALGGSASTWRGSSSPGQGSARCSRPPWVRGWNIAAVAPYNGQLLKYSGQLLKERHHEAHRGDRGAGRGRNRTEANRFYGGSITGVVGRYDATL